MAEYNLRRRESFQQPSSQGGLEEVALQRLRERIRVRPLDWGESEMIASLHPPYDLILGSDVMYVGADGILLLAETILALSGPGTKVGSLETLVDVGEARQLGQGRDESCQTS